MAKLTKEQQERYGYTDEQVDALKENQIRLIKGIEGLTKYRVVAEVVESNNCGWNAKVGDKIVLNGPGWILPAECSNKENLCLFAVAKLVPFSMMVYDRACSGQDPNEMIFKRVRCEDPGVDHCGWGQIVMDVRAEQVD